MPASPYKRDRRYKSRMSAQSDAERVSVRERALEMAQKGLNRRGGPVDKGPPDVQKRAAQRMQGEKREARNSRMKATLGRPEVNRNEGSPRFGQRYRTIMRKGGEVHQYAGGNRVFVAKDGTGNQTMRARKPAGDSIDAQINDLARRRATQNRPKARRRLFSQAG